MRIEIVATLFATLTVPAAAQDQRLFLHCEYHALQPGGDQKGSFDVVVDELNATVVADGDRYQEGRLNPKEPELVETVSITPIRIDFGAATSDPKNIQSYGYVIDRVTGGFQIVINTHVASVGTCAKLSATPKF